MYHMQRTKYHLIHGLSPLLNSNPLLIFFYGFGLFVVSLRCHFPFPVLRCLMPSCSDEEGSIFLNLVFSKAAQTQFMSRSKLPH